MKPSDERKWSWWAVELDSPDDVPESYQLNEPTREAVLQAALRANPGCWVSIVEGTQDGPFEMRPFSEEDDCPRVGTAFDWFLDDNGARWGEDGPDFMLVQKDLAKLLNDAFESYLRANQAELNEAAWSFTETRNAEVLFMGIAH